MFLAWLNKSLPFSPGIRRDAKLAAATLRWKPKSCHVVDRGSGGWIHLRPEQYPCPEGPIAPRTVALDVTHYVTSSAAHTCGKLASHHRGAPLNRNPRPPSEQE